MLKVFTFFVSCLIGQQIHAAQLVISEGNLIGATGVQVGQTLYNVSFIDGSCIDIFTGCNQQHHFTFSDLSDANIASQALLEQVLINLPAPNTFDDDPEKSNLCSNSGLCVYFTPYDLAVNTELAGNPLEVLVSSAFNRSKETESSSPDGVGHQSFSRTEDLAITNTGNLVGYAVWTPANPVPIPASGLTMISALALLFGARYTRHDKTS